ncbi:heparan-alpha-glucosaminide N-acetyltransferase domain-containing protein [Actinomycetospora rhizophila]|uniref:Heparan-alpha-glucosaminide N-acetyltransferase domain-containing protein n=1 Tax=Actinomycetospora rhizophila TaxID=1416876 RepID=A0ABV9Z6T3_9PSEU
MGRGPLAPYQEDMHPDTAARPTPRPPTSPPPTKARLLGVDAARGVALLGMMAVHSFSETTETGDPSVTQLVAGGRSAALFAVLAGVAIAFMTRRRQVTRGPSGRAAVATLLTRAGVIGAIGVVGLGWIDSETAIAVILPAYAVMFLLAIPLVFLSTRAVLVTGAAVALVVPFVSQLVRAGLPEPSGDNIGFVSLVDDPVGVVLELLLTGSYPALTWMAYIAVGLGVGRLTLSSARVAGILIGLGAALAAAGSALSWALLGPLGGAARLTAQSGLDPATVTEVLTLGPDGAVPPGDVWWLATATPHSGTPLDLAATIGSSLAVLGAFLLLGHLPGGVRRVSDALQAPLVAAGSMTLTLYVVHAAFMGSDFSQGDSVPEYVGQALLLFAAAFLWRRRFSRGPLEALAGTLATRAAVAAGREDGVPEPTRPPVRPPSRPAPPPARTDDAPTGPIRGLPVPPGPPLPRHLDPFAAAPRRTVPGAAPGWPPPVSGRR